MTRQKKFHSRQTYHHVPRCSQQMHVVLKMADSLFWDSFYLHFLIMYLVVRCQSCNISPQCVLKIIEAGRRNSLSEQKRSDWNSWLSESVMLVRLLLISMGTYYMSCPAKWLFAILLWSIKYSIAFQIFWKFCPLDIVGEVATFLVGCFRGKANPNAGGRKII